MDQLKSKHPSRPRNKNIAEIFFRAGYIESWGRGIDRILRAFDDAGLPEPIFEEIAGGVQVTFFKDSYTQERLRSLGINKRQIIAILYVKKHGSITNKEYQAINDLGKSVSATELAELVEKQLLERIGTTGRATMYVLKS
ncbi:ATP-binding protein [Algoriphagus sp.]|uniref:ATP-binding protein n=1 Tax=Algoriphagus sp. TaxID=1872435 RepID=UPI003F727338